MSNDANMRASFYDPEHFFSQPRTMSISTARTSTTPSMRIRQARTKARLSQTEVAKALEVHRSAVSQWESATGSIPTVENLMGLATVTGTNFEWLALGRGRMLPDQAEAELHPIHPDCIANDWHEEQLLRDFRLLAPLSRKALIEFLDSVKRRR